MSRKFEMVQLNKDGEIGRSLSVSHANLIVSMAYGFKEQIRHTYSPQDWERGIVTPQDAAIIGDLSDIIEIVGASTAPHGYRAANDN